MQLHSNVPDNNVPGSIELLSRTYCIVNVSTSTILYPQGFVLGPQWFTVYAFPVRDIILKYNLNYHVYADDTQHYITFKYFQEPADSCITYNAGEMYSRDS